MRKTFDDRLIDAVRLTGPNAFPSAICAEMDRAKPSLFGTSLGRIYHRLDVLVAEGVLRKTIVSDDKGRDRRAYSMGNGTLRQREMPVSGRLAIA